MSDDDLDAHLKMILASCGHAPVTANTVGRNALRLVVDEAVRAERERCLALVKHRWTFDNDQHHTHNWHAMADTVADIIDGKHAPEPPKPKPRRTIRRAAS